MKKYLDNHPLVLLLLVGFLLALLVVSSFWYRDAQRDYLLSRGFGQTSSLKTPERNRFVILDDDALSISVQDFVGTINWYTRSQDSMTFEQLEPLQSVGFNMTPTNGKVVNIVIPPTAKAYSVVGSPVPGKSDFKVFHQSF
jgi:hypothetical protein